LAAQVLQPGSNFLKAGIYCFHVNLKSDHFGRKHKMKTFKRAV